MFDILLIYPPYEWVRKNPPLGIAYIASYMEKLGYKITIIDMAALEMNLEVLKNEIKRIKPKIVGISSMTPQFRSAIAITQTIKSVDRNIPVVMGGPHVSAVSEQVLKQVEEIDFVVIGEGEITFAELSKKIFKNNNKFCAIDGLVWRSNGSVVKNKPRGYIEDLDSQPFPAWHLLPVKKYSPSAVGGDVSKQVFTLLSSRGCPFQCIFCDSHTIFGRKFRGRTAENIYQEIVYLMKSFDATQFDFVDDTITINKNRLLELCDMIMDNGLNIVWMCNSRVNTVDYEILKKMRAAGCRRIDFGVESGDPKVRKILKKGITNEQIIDAHKWAKQVGMTTTSFFMVGNPGEDFKSIKNTVEFIKEIETDFPGVSVATPFPGTELYRMAKEKGWLEEQDVTKYDSVPHASVTYKPAMRTDLMSSEEIVRAYYYVNSKIMTLKFRTKYGKKYYFNPYFYKDRIFHIKNIQEMKHKLSIAFRLIFSKNK